MRVNNNLEASLERLKTSSEWEEHKNDSILDRDGWRTDRIFELSFEPCNFNSTYITEFEYLKRKSMSTCMIKG